MCKPIKHFTVGVGHHRGHERIWLESKRFDNTAFTAGTPITAVITKNKIIIKAGTSNTAEGKELKVSKIHSKRGKPILDLSNNDIGIHFPDVLKVTVTISGDTITIVPSIKDDALGGYRPLNNKEFVEFFSGGGIYACNGN